MFSRLTDNEQHFNAAASPRPVSSGTWLDENVIKRQIKICLSRSLLGGNVLNKPGIGVKSRWIEAVPNPPPITLARSLGMS